MNNLTYPVHIGPVPFFRALRRPQVAEGEKKDGLPPARRRAAGKRQPTSADGLQLDVPGKEFIDALGWVIGDACDEGAQSCGV